MITRSVFARSAFAVAAAGLFVLSAPAVAAETKDQAAPAEAAVPSERAASAKEKTYCVSDSISGTRLPKKVCKTKKQWQAEGVDPTNG